jgi:hypothetical protein
MSNPSWYHTFETITQRWFSKTVVTFRYELEIGILFEVGLKTIIHMFYPPPLWWGSKNLDCPNSVPLLEFVSCFKIHAETLRNSLGHTFHPIELKLGVLPTFVIQYQKKIQKIESKSQKLDFN